VALGAVLGLLAAGFAVHLVVYRPSSMLTHGTLLVWPRRGPHVGHMGQMYRVAKHEG
jgi:hypothetical protein